MSLTPSNMISRFKKTGIYPFNRDAFSDEDFLGADVIDRPDNVAERHNYESNYVNPEIVFFFWMMRIPHHSTHICGMQVVTIRLIQVRQMCVNPDQLLLYAHQLNLLPKTRPRWNHLLTPI